MIVTSDYNVSDHLPVRTHHIEVHYLLVIAKRLGLAHALKIEWSTHYWLLAEGVFHDWNFFNPFALRDLVVFSCS